MALRNRKLPLPTGQGTTPWMFQLVRELEQKFFDDSQESIDNVVTNDSVVNIITDGNKVRIDVAGSTTGEVRILRGEITLVTLSGVNGYFSYHVIDETNTGGQTEYSLTSTGSITSGVITAQELK